MVIFADDCLLFIKATTSPVRLGKKVLDSFCTAEDFKINADKSRFLASRNLNHARVEGFESIMGFTQTQKIDKYLDFPIFTGRFKNSGFAFILDKMKGRLAGWKSKLLN